MRKYGLFVAAALLLAVICSTGMAVTYEVGDGKAYTSIGAVPWESLNAGDTVLIYYRSTAYKEKFVLGRVGTSGSPITVRGVPDGSGNLPVIDGQNATTRTQLSTGSENRGIITMQQWTTSPPACRPSYIVIENLEFKNASVPYTFTDDSGATVSYVNSSAAIWIADGRNITIRNCYIHDCGNGVFTYSAGTGTDNWTQDILVEGCYITACGNSGRVYEHSSYTESLNITFQYNRYGPPRGGDTNSIGNSIKDRSAGLVVRYNWIEGGNRTLDIVDPEDSATLGNHANYEKTYMYGNFLIERNDAGNRQVVHFGGDMTGVYRPKGYFYNNTVVSYRSAATTLVMQNGGSTSTFDCRNNIIYVTAAGSNLTIMTDSDGIVNFRNNWMKTGYVLKSGGGTMNDYGGHVVGTSPGFVNEGGQDFRLAAGSGCINAGTTLHADCSAHPLSRQYVKHQSSETRPSDGTLDIGANEYAAAGTSATYQFTSADTESSTTSTSYQTKATLTFTPAAADDWIIFGFAEIKGSSESYSTLARLVVDGTTDAEITQEANDATDYVPFTTVKFRNLTAASHTITLQYRSTNSGSTAYIRRARIVAIRKAALEYRQTASDSTVALTTSLANYATLTFTPASSGNYLVIYSAEVSANTAYSTQVQAKVPGGAAWDDCWVESKDNTDYMSWMSILPSYSCSTSSQTFQIAAAKESGSSATHNIRRARIVAIRLDGRFADNVAGSSDAEATTTSTSWQQKYSKSWTWGANGNWLMLVSARLGGSSVSYSTECRAQFNDATDYAVQLREPNDTTDYMQFGCIDVRNLGSTRKMDIDYRSESTSATAKIKTVRFIGLPLD